MSWMVSGIIMPSSLPCLITSSSKNVLAETRRCLQVFLLLVMCLFVTLRVAFALDGGQVVGARARGSWIYVELSDTHLTFSFNARVS